MSDLETFGAHARAMSEAEHRVDCEGQRRRWVNRWDEAREGWRGDWVDPACPGCVTDDDRALWARLADEVDAYLHTEPEETLL